MKWGDRKTTGFTLIELLVVISLLAILAVVAAVIYSNLQASSRDSSRKADIVAISKAYESGYSNGFYHPVTGAGFSAGRIPTDPRGVSYGGLLPSDAEGFQVCAALEDNPTTSCDTTSSTCFCIQSVQGTYVPGTSPTPTPTDTPTPTPTSTPSPSPSPSPTPPPTITIGETTILGTNDSGNGGRIYAQKVTLNQTATIQSLSFAVRVTGGRLQLGIYDDLGGLPYSLKTSTVVFTPVLGWNTQNVATPVSLPAGDYWLAYEPESSSLGYYVQPSGGAGGAGMSNPFGSLASIFVPDETGTFYWSFYGTLQP